MRGSHQHDKVSFAPLSRALRDAGISYHQALSLSDVGLTAYNVARKNGLSVYIADRLAVRALNVHPTYIWGDEWLNRDSLDDPMVDLRIRALEEAWALRREVAS